jgi:hypothetical protein
MDISASQQFRSRVGVTKAVQSTGLTETIAQHCVLSQQPAEYGVEVMGLLPVTETEHTQGQACC